MLRAFHVPLSWGDLLKRTAREVIADNCLGLAAELGFYFFLALFPALLFLVSLVSYIIPIVATLLGWAALGEHIGYGLIAGDRAAADAATPVLKVIYPRSQFVGPAGTATKTCTMIRAILRRRVEGSPPAANASR